MSAPVIVMSAQRQKCDFVRFCTAMDRLDAVTYGMRLVRAELRWRRFRKAS